MNDIKGLLFDLDGVLLDTEGTYTQFWSAIDAAFPTHVDNFASVIKGSNLDYILNKYFAKENHGQIVAMLNDFQRDMEYHFFPGAIELLGWAKTAGLKTCLVTSSDRKKMDAVYLQHPDFRQYFDAVVTGEMVGKPKPAPECFILGASLIGLETGDCVVLEDSLNGVVAGRDSGATVVAIATTLPPSRLRDYATIVVGDTEEAFDMIKKNLHI